MFAGFHLAFVHALYIYPPKKCKQSRASNEKLFFGMIDLVWLVEGSEPGLVSINMIQLYESIDPYITWIMASPPWYRSIGQDCADVRWQVWRWLSYQFFGSIALGTSIPLKIDGWKMKCAFKMVPFLGSAIVNCSGKYTPIDPSGAKMDDEKRVDMATWWVPCRPKITLEGRSW